MGEGSNVARGLLPRFSNLDVLRDSTDLCILGTSRLTDDRQDLLLVAE
jgi:hypothetical protein